VRFTQAQICFASLLLIALTLQGTRLTAILRSTLMRLSGALSYCIYLIHFAVGDGYQFLAHYFRLKPAVLFGEIGAIVVRGLFIVTVSFGIALLSKKYLEDPFLRLKQLFQDIPSVSPEKPPIKVIYTPVEVSPDSDLIRFHLSPAQKYPDAAKDNQR
jgi:peptidoglycan/LPS O-acetylase OafA/YrhL